MDPLELARGPLFTGALLFFIGGWIVLPGSAWLWTFLAFATPGAYLIGGAFSAFAKDIRRGLPGDIVHDFITGLMIVKAHHHPAGGMAGILLHAAGIHAPRGHGREYPFPQFIITDLAHEQG